MKYIFGFILGTIGGFLGGYTIIKAFDIAAATVNAATVSLP